MNRTTQVLCGAALVSLGAVTVNAATVTSVQTFTGEKTNQFTRTIAPAIGVGVASGTNALGVFDLVDPQFEADLFDSSLGTLQSVEITYSGRLRNANGVRTLQNLCSDTGFDSSCESRTLSVDYSIDYGVFSSVGSVDEVSENRTAKLRNSNFSFVGGGADLFASTTMTGASDLAAYTGTGTLDLTAFFFPYLDGTYTCDPDGGTILLQCRAQYRAEYGAAFKIDLTYVYDDGSTPPTPTEVPLPASALLLLAGLGTFGFSRRR